SSRCCAQTRLCTEVDRGHFQWGPADREAASRFRVTPSVAPNWNRVLQTRATSSGKKPSVGRQVLGGVLGAAGGFVLGGALGAAIEGHRCGCDDPGLTGRLIGAPVGAVAGLIVGVKAASQ